MASSDKGDEEEGASVILMSKKDPNGLPIMGDRGQSCSMETERY